MTHSTDGPITLDDITVVIPTLGRSILKQCLKHIASASHRPSRLIVVDQGRLPATQRLLEDGTPQIATLYIPSEQLGRAAGVNRGIREVTTRFVAITDDDCFVDSRWLQALTFALREKPDSVVTGRVLTPDDSPLTSVTSQVPAVYDRPRIRFDSLSGGNMATSVSVFATVGPFDESPSVRTAEDGEWAYRALRSGIPLVYVPDAVVTHHDWRDPEQRLQQYRAYARSHGGFYGKYLRKGDVFIAFRAILHHGLALRRFLRGVLRRDREQSRQGWAYFVGLLPGILAGLRERK